MTDHETVARFVELLEEHRDLDKVVATLRRAGVTELDCEFLVAFVPMAFAHVILKPMGVVLPQTFVATCSATDDRARGTIADEPVFASASQLCEKMLPTAPGRARSIAGLSAEWAAVEDLLPTARGAKGIVLTEPLLCRIAPSDLRQRKVAATPRAKAWWQFWSRS